MENMEKEEEDILLNELTRLQQSKSGRFIYKERVIMIAIWLGVAALFWTLILSLVL
jgi:hypothetical protein